MGWVTGWNCAAGKREAGGFYGETTEGVAGVSSMPIGNRRYGRLGNLRHARVESILHIHDNLQSGMRQDRIDETE